MLLGHQPSALRVHSWLCTVWAGWACGILRVWTLAARMAGQVQLACLVLAAREGFESPLGGARLALQTRALLKVRFMGAVRSAG